MQEKHKLNILTLNYEYPPVGGGGGYICKNVMDELAERGHQITVITSHYNRLAKEESLENIKIYLPGSLDSFTKTHGELNASLRH